ncbi:unnamed protein product [Protopolystoma xenopodis]|uniref:Uncharacterized protein n=1 Tax=Protopolystoma xenopodis TaxID=117903 RepID=A0A3S5BFP6_9PLAT|nr:unnamed protein product [Protopolystoma xenopodis]
MSQPSPAQPSWASFRQAQPVSPCFAHLDCRLTARHSLATGTRHCRPHPSGCTSHTGHQLMAQRTHARPKSRLTRHA